MQPRELLLNNWLQAVAPHPVQKLIPLVNDASFRRYYRVLTTKAQFVLMDAPPERGNIDNFIALSHHFAAQGLPVPHIYQQDITLGLVLLSDFGDQLLLNALTSSAQADRWYPLALQTSVQLQQQGATGYDFSSFDAASIYLELGYFKPWCLEQWLGMQLTASANIELENCFELLAQSMLAQPYQLIHRDYHSRNLLILPEQTLGMIDYQDALWGPITYDAVSLLRDCYVAWSEVKIEQWLASYYRQLLAAQLLPAVSFAQFYQWFDWAGLQRHLKVLGIFARLKIRDQKPHYLADTPKIVAYILQVSAKYPELKGLALLFSEQLLPQFQQAWAKMGLSPAITDVACAPLS